MQKWLKPLRKNIAETISAIWDFTAGLKTNTISESTADTGVTCDGVLLKDGNIKGNNLNIKPYSGEVADDGTITLPAAVSGKLWVQDADGDEGEFSIAADGTVTYIRLSANCDDADTDTDLCVYDGGSGAVIKNRKGSAKVVKYTFEYS